MQFSISRSNQFENITNKEVYEPSVFINVPYMKMSIALNAGYHDTIVVKYKKDKCFYALSYITGLPCVGLEIFDREGEPMGSIFLQESQVYEVLGDEPFEYSDNYIIRVLSNYIE